MMMFSKVEAGKQVADAVLKVDKTTKEIVKIVENPKPKGLTQEEDQRAKELEDRVKMRKKKLMEDHQEIVRQHEEQVNPKPLIRL